MTRNNYITALILSTLCINQCMAQAQSDTPRLIVAITVDQLRSENIHAYSKLFVPSGFNKLFSEGRVYERTVNDFYPVDRASAIATIATGATPYYNGIPGTSWLDRSTLRPMFCTDDKKAKSTSGHEVASTRNLLVSTVADELKVSTQGLSKVIGIAAEKDAAILSVGHAADLAIWIDDRTGEWASATDNKSASNSWLLQFGHKQQLPKIISNAKWTSSVKHEYIYNGKSSNQETFSYSFNDKNRYSDYKRCPLANADITDLALHALDANHMGADDMADFLAITYYAGNFNDNNYLDNHLEVEDTYVRLDLQLSRLISTIEQKVGRERVLFVLTSTGYNYRDNAGYLQMGIPSGTFYINRTANLLNMYLSAMYGQGQYVDGTYHNQIYINHQFVEQKHLSLSEVYKQSRDFLCQSDGVTNIHTKEQILASENTDKVRNAYVPTLSGDIIVEIAPGWKLVNENTDETMSSSDSFYAFPVIFYGSNVESGKFTELVTTDCIAPTICKSIKIRAPNACKNLPLF